MVDEISPQYKTQLHKKLVSSFSEEEIRTLCFDLGLSYEDLGGRGREANMRELVEQCTRNGNIPSLVSWCSQQRPKIVWTYQTKLFIGYKRSARVDNQLAAYLYTYLTAQGHEVFIDKTIRSGTTWLDEIDQQIKSADFLIVLLSQESADSEMLQSEVQRAYEYRKQQEYPRILPVRLNYEGLLPYAVAAFLNPLQHILWRGEADNEQVSQEIITTINGRFISKQAVQLQLSKKKQTISEDGRLLDHNDNNSLHPPLPEFDPRLLTELVVPGGATKLRDQFYIERTADAILRTEIVKWGSTITIRAPRQTGKTSLLMRSVHNAKHNGLKSVFLDVQTLGHKQLTSPNIFLHELAETICHELRLESADLGKAWQGIQSPQKKLTYFLEDTVLPAFDAPIILSIDEADALLAAPFYQDFFGLLRSWHNRRAKDEVWEKLNIVLIISTEPYLLIDDINQSPFNVGLKIELSDFNDEQVRHLNHQHGLPVPSQYLPDLMKLLNGHPYLTRRLLYALVKERLSWKDLSHIAATDEGPFADHLRHHFWLLRDKPELREAFKQIIRKGSFSDETAVFRLLRAGLIKGSGDIYTCRCDLYRRYFDSKL